MQNKSEKGITSGRDVIPAVALFLGRHDKEDFTEAPATMQEMFNNLMATDYGNDSKYRERMLVTLDMIKDFVDTLEPFSGDEIWESVKGFSNV
jgi:hypothetical protein